MAYLAKYNKAVLIDLAKKLGLEPSPNPLMIHLKNLIVNRDSYDEEVTKTLVESLGVQAQEEFEREEKKRKRQEEFEERKGQDELAERKRQEEHEERMKRYEIEGKKRQEEHEERLRQIELEGKKKRKEHEEWLRQIELEFKEKKEKLRKEVLRRERQAEFEENERQMELQRKKRQKEWEERKEVEHWKHEIELTKLKLVESYERRRWKRLAGEEAQEVQQEVRIRPVYRIGKESHKHFVKSENREKRASLNKPSLELEVKESPQGQTMIKNVFNKKFKSPSDEERLLYYRPNRKVLPKTKEVALQVSPRVNIVSSDSQNRNVEPIEVVKLRNFEIKSESYDKLQLSGISVLKSSGVLGNTNLKVSDIPISSDAKASVKPQTVTKRSEENSLGIPQTGSKNGDKISCGITQVKLEPSAKRSLDIVKSVKGEEIIVPSTKFKVMKTSLKVVNNVLGNVVVSEKPEKSSRQRTSGRKRYVKIANKVLVKESASGKQVKRSRQRYLFRKGDIKLANHVVCKSTVSDEGLKCSRQKLSVRKAYAKIVGRKPSVAKIKVLFLHKEEIMLFRDTELSWFYKVHRQRYKHILILVVCNTGSHSSYKLKYFRLKNLIVMSQLFLKIIIIYLGNTKINKVSLILFGNLSFKR